MSFIMVPKILNDDIDAIRYDTIRFNKNGKLIKLLLHILPVYPTWQT